MNYEQAKIRLRIHGSLISNDESWLEGFLGLLKPYRKQIPDSLFKEIIECLRVSFSFVNNVKTIDAEIIAGVQGILHFGRLWVSDPESGLRKSGKMSDEEINRVECWLALISEIYTLMISTNCSEEYLFGIFLENRLKGTQHSI
nr:hypothetical protein [uncultured Methylotenera sp.]